ncbi:MAG: DNA alkylation repair protein [Rickettsiales bacterium]|nr:DNA alkylation repair protein [Rickettsiales bacterium]
MSPDLIVEELRRNGSKAYAKYNYSYFKCGGGYGSPDDEFCGIKSGPLRRIVAKHWKDADWCGLETLISHKMHEARMFALLALAEKYGASDAAGRRKIAGFYLSHAKYIDNWDLVDLSAHKILGRHCYDTGNIAALRKLAASKNLWRERISIVATYYFIKRGEFAPTIEFAEKFIGHKHDLIHKAAGWMLREAGKAGDAGYRALLAFLDGHARDMPRTMLRYAIERMPKELREKYMEK